MESGQIVNFGHNNIYTKCLYPVLHLMISPKDLFPIILFITVHNTAYINSHNYTCYCIRIISLPQKIIHRLKRLFLRQSYYNSREKTVLSKKATLKFLRALHINTFKYTTLLHSHTHKNTITLNMFDRFSFKCSKHNKYIHDSGCWHFHPDCSTGKPF